MTAGALPFSRDKFFAELEPQLVRIARKYKTADAIGEARSWFVHFADIFNAIDQNPVHTIFEPNGTELRERVIGYMITSFKRKLLERDKFIQPISSSPGDDGEPADEASGQTEPYHHPTSADLVGVQLYTLDDLLSIIKTDAKKLVEVDGVRAAVNRHFVGALLAHYERLRAELGDFPIVQDPAAEKLRGFFVREVLDGRFNAIQSALKNAYESEANLETKKALEPLLASNYSPALRQKIAQYFSKRHGGLPKRLLRKTQTQ